MNKKILSHAILFIALIFGMSSCDLGGNSNYIPQLSFANPAILNSSDSLTMGYTDEGNIKLDSLHVNDTVTVWVLGNGFTNSLKKLDISVTEIGDVEILAPHDTITQYFDASSDFVGGKIVFPENTGGMSYPFRFVTAKQTSKTKIKFLLTSDAQEVSNVSGLQLEFPIK
ncbi:MAG: hypothetical protein ACK5KP_05070 [Paludibacteraceae bacterium]